jgi:hypothetical protein
MSISGAPILDLGLFPWYGNYGSKKRYNVPTTLDATPSRSRRIRTSREFLMEAARTRGVSYPRISA